jgi:hypothetical protein
MPRTVFLWYAATWHERVGDVPPDHLSEEEISFLMHFYPRLYSLPGGADPNADLRRCLAFLLREFPASMRNPMASVHKFLEERRQFHQKELYQSDLERDFLRLLGEVVRSAKEMPIQTTVDFRFKPRR